MGASLARAWRRDPAWTAVLVVAFAVMLFFLAWPLGTMFAAGFKGGEGKYGFSGYASFFANRAYRESLWNTLILGGSVTATSLFVGGALAVLVVEIIVGKAKHGLMASAVRLRPA